jgi:LuxR family maltose regulon positive regulatory protein
VLGELELYVDDDPAYWREGGYLALARLYIARGQHAEVLGLLERMLSKAERQGRVGQAIAVLCLQALAWRVGGMDERALALLERALALAQPEGFVRIFVDGGPAIENLLHRAAQRAAAARRAALAQRSASAREGASSFVAELLAAFDASLPQATPTPDANVQRFASSVRLGALTRRERQVLALLASERSVQEIADALTIARSTVRSHVKHIYEKLDVHSRTQAVIRGQELGLL